MRLNNPFNKRTPEAAAEEAAEGPMFGKREGFSILVHKFELPEENLSLDPKPKRALTICNLFINHRMAVSEIAQLLEADVDQVVKILVQKKIVGERRESHRTGHQMLNGVSPRGFQLRRISVRRSVGESFELLPFRHSGREWATFA